jgi:hypothetical protein
MQIATAFKEALARSIIDFRNDLVFFSCFFYECNPVFIRGMDDLQPLWLKESQVLLKNRLSIPETSDCLGHSNHRSQRTRTFQSFQLNCESLVVTELKHFKNTPPVDLQKED